MQQSVASLLLKLIRFSHCSECIEDLPFQSLMSPLFQYQFQALGLKLKTKILLLIMLHQSSMCCISYHFSTFSRSSNYSISRYFFKGVYKKNHLKSKMILSGFKFSMHKKVILFLFLFLFHVLARLHLPLLVVFYFYIYPQE